MKSSDVFQSKYLRKEDLPNPVTLTIQDVQPQMIDGDNGAKEKKAVVTFTDGRFKPLILNKGNWLTIEAVYGDDSDAWRGKPIEVYNDPSVMYKGERKGGLRVRVPSANGSRHTTTQAWTMEQAVAECAKCGITRDHIIEKLKSLGRGGWNMLRDTPTVQDMITTWTAKSQPDNEEEFAAADNNEIPF